MTKANLIRIFGTDEPPEKARVLSAGNLSVEIKGGSVGSVFYQGIEVLRGIAFLVRDENWGTCAVLITESKISRRKDGFTLNYTAIAQNVATKLTYHATLTATPDSLDFHATAQPYSDFRTNRTGFVVLHPIDGVAGASVQVTHTDGMVEQAQFPKLISPGQPFFDIRALEHAPVPGLRAKVTMLGSKAEMQKFEMEDQRNWSDASFKTYVSSLLDPWPYTLKGGDSFEQRITLKISGSAKRKRPQTTNALRFGSALKLPEIGIAIPQDQALASLSFIGKIRTLAPAHLTCGLKDTPQLAEICAAYAKIQCETAVPITLEILLPGKTEARAEMAAFAAACLLSGLKPARIVVSQQQDLQSFQPSDIRPPAHSYAEMADAARHYFPKAKIGGGMFSYFTELNRKLPPQELFDFITHSLCPIVHDASDEAVMQTLQTLPHIFASARAIAGSAPYHLGPSSIGARLNPYGSSLAQNPASIRMCLAPNDPRQNGTFACAWNLGLLVAASQARLESVTLSALLGPQGLVADDGTETPLFAMLAAFMPMSGQPIRVILGTNIAAFSSTTHDKPRIWIANLAGKAQAVTLQAKTHRIPAYSVKRI